MARLHLVADHSVGKKLFYTPLLCGSKYSINLFTPDVAKVRFDLIHSIIMYIHVLGTGAPRKSSVKRFPFKTDRAHDHCIHCTYYSTRKLFGSLIWVNYVFGVDDGELFFITRKRENVMCRF